MKKGSRLYMLFLGVFLIIIFIIEYSAPHKFVWNKTYDRNDREPFGSYVFDDIAKSSLKNGYEVTYHTLYQIYKSDTTVFDKAFLITESRINMTSDDVGYLYKLLHNGNRVMLCAEDFSLSLEDTIGFESETGKYFEPLQNYIRYEPQRDKIFFGPNRLKPEQSWEVYPQMHGYYLSLEQPEQDVLVRDQEGKALAARFVIGKGELILVATPLMFTNFGILDRQNASYAFRLLALLGDRHVTRIEAYDNSKKASSPLRYILSETPLRHALYFALILLVVFMIFNSRRRQRVIPVVNAPPNRLMGFMMLISNLYYQRHNNAEMLKIKQLSFYSEMKRLIGTDLSDRTPNDADFQRIADKTGIETSVISTLIKNINIAVYRFEASDLQLKQFVDGMNDLLRGLKI
ncbi:MAG: DUF4350 domain-containing protein [Tannerella sp.]|jgi:hypothetical protein|nr:DUF4350 domain-containing protein [Tannerella sp.]